MVAVKSGKASPLGEVYNELPDRISDAATLIGAGYAAASIPCLGFVAACVALLIAYIRAIGKIATGRQDYSGPMAKPHRMFVMTLASLFGAAAPAAWQRADCGWNFMAIALGVIILGGIITACHRVARLARALKGPSC
jgi:phosphatidylglycerophosphate synthase